MSMMSCPNISSLLKCIFFAFFAEEEIDVVGICDSASVINQSRLIRTAKTNLPTKPNANEQRTLQLAVEAAAAAHNGPSSILCGAKRRRIEEIDDNYVPSTKLRNVDDAKTNTVALLPKKVQIPSSKKSVVQKRNCSKRTVANSCNRSDCEDDSMNMKDRSQHNSMERKRRDDLRSSFFTLRDQVR